MRFKIGPIPETAEFSPDDSWRPLHEPTPWVMQFLALPIGIVTAVAVAYLWFLTTPLDNAMDDLSAPAFLFSFAGIIIVHELIHAAVHPGSGRSTHTILGFWPSKILFYAHYDGELKRNRFLAILLMPLMVISLVPIFLAVAAQLNVGWAAFLSTLNAFLACGDVFGAGIVLFQVPATAIVRNQGYRTYWREHRTPHAEQDTPADG